MRVALVSLTAAAILAACAPTQKAAQPQSPDTAALQNQPPIVLRTPWTPQRTADCISRNYESLPGRRPTRSFGVAGITLMGVDEKGAAAMLAGVVAGPAGTEVTLWLDKALFPQQDVARKRLLTGC